MTLVVSNPQPFTSSAIGLSTVAYRRSPAQQERWVQRSMVQTYAAAFGKVEKDLDDLMGKWQAAADAGKPVSPSWAMRQTRYERLLRQYHDAIMAYGDSALSLTQGAMSQAVAHAVAYTPKEVQQAAGTAPTGFPGAGFDSETWTTVNHAMVRNMTAFLNNQASPLRKLFTELGTDTYNSVRRTFSEGLATGIGPKRLASRIKNNTANIALGRARVIARTEYHRAYRYAKREQYMASPVIKGWVWRAKMDGSCGVCLAMSGSVHPASEVLESHPNCRCVMVPLTKSWDELGFPGYQAGISATNPGVTNLDDWIRGDAGRISQAMSAFGKNRFRMLAEDVAMTGNWTDAARKWVQRTANPLWGGGRKLQNIRAPKAPTLPTTVASAVKGAISFLRDPVGVTLAKAQAAWVGREAARQFLLKEWKLKTGAPVDTGGVNANQAKTEIAAELGDRLVDKYADLLASAPQSRIYTFKEFGNRYSFGMTKTWAAMTEAERKAFLLTDEGRQFAREVASDWIQSWAASSGDTHDLSVALQRAAQEELGLAGETTHFRQSWTTALNADPNLIGTMRAFIREMYDYTQAEFRAMGITEVTLTRGIGYESSKVPADWKSLGVGDEKLGTVTGQPLSSWAAEPNVAELFSGMGSQQFLLTARIPVEWVVGTARTGFGCFHETEFVIASPRSFEAMVRRRT